MLGADPLAIEVLTELGSGEAVADPALIEALGEHLVSGGGSLESIAELAGVTVVECPLAMPGFHTGNLVLIRAGQRERARRVAWVHECCHPVAARAGFGHCHADVWRLSLAALAPLSVLREHRRWRVGDLAARCAVPWWAAYARTLTLGYTRVRR